MFGICRVVGFVTRLAAIQEVRRMVFCQNLGGMVIIIIILEDGCEIAPQMLC
jgi:hypothetical protein